LIKMKKSFYQHTLYNYDFVTFSTLNWVVFSDFVILPI
jgi:hypothetical protein